MTNDGIKNPNTNITSVMDVNLPYGDSNGSKARAKITESEQQVKK